MRWLNLYPRECTFEHVKFGYKEDSILMKDLNIDVKAGQTIAIVGPTGAARLRWLTC